MDKPLIHVLVVLLMYTVRTECSGIPKCTTMYKSLGYVGHSHFFYMDKMVDWYEANRTCHSYPNTHLATFHDEYTLHVIMQRAAPVHGLVGKKAAFYFGGHELMFEKWRWLDDQIYDGEMVDYGGDSKKTCGLVHGRKADQLAYSTCTSGKRFLCVNPDADSTNLGADDYYISTTAEAESWFRAREICLCRGMELAMAKDGSVDYIYTLLNGSTNHFWIGLQKARFVWENTGEAIDYLPFQAEQPDYYESIEDCLHVVDGEYNDVHCTNKYSFFCELEYTSNLPDSDSAARPPKVAKHHQSEETLPKENTGNAGIIAAVVISVLVVLVVNALTVALVVRIVSNGNTGIRWLRFGRENTGDEGM